MITIYDPAFWLYFLSWFFFLLYVLIYGIGSPWYQSLIGRALLLSNLAIVLVLTNALIVIVFGDYPAKETVRGVLLGLVIASAVYQLVALIRTRFPNRDTPDHKHRRSTDQGDG
jgi:asparagine N-glycosylation enzyme membrane subunit Stt3